MFNNIVFEKNHSRISFVHSELKHTKYILLGSNICFLGCCHVMKAGQFEIFKNMVIISIIINN